MKRLLAELVCFLAIAAFAAAAQINPTALSNAPSDDAPRGVEVRADGRCTTVRPGDTVRYALTVANLSYARALYGDLRLRLGRTHGLMRGDLPLPDFRSLGGGGLGTRDADDARQYHFSFTVPKEIVGGTYRGVAVEVRTEPPPRQPSMYRTEYEQAPPVVVTRHTHQAVRAYCLNVMSDFGISPVRPSVVNFEPGEVAPTPPVRKPEPLPQQPSMVPLEPVPQPR